MANVSVRGPSEKSRTGKRKKRKPERIESVPSFFTTSAPDLKSHAGDEAPLSPTAARPESSSLWKNLIDPSVLAALDANEIQRQELIHEIVETERSYLADIELMFSLYLTPIKEAKLLSVQDVKAIFGNIEDIYAQANLPLLKALQQRQRESLLGAADASVSVIERIGDILLDHCNLFKLYAHYASNYPWVQGRLAELEAANAPFSKFLRDAAKRRVSQNRVLTDFLILPLHRICKYPLFLQQLVKYTDESTVEYGQLVESEIHIKDIVSQINERTRTVENIVRLTAIEQTLSNAAELDLVQRGRLVIKEGPAAVRKASDKESQWKNAVVYLLSDAVLVKIEQPGDAAPTWIGEKYPLAGTSVQEAPASFACKKDTVVVDEELLPLCFVVATGGSSGERLLFRVQRASMKNAWLKEFDKALTACAAQAANSSASASNNDDGEDSKGVGALLRGMFARTPRGGESDEQAAAFPGIKLREIPTKGKDTSASHESLTTAPSGAQTERSHTRILNHLKPMRRRNRTELVVELPNERNGAATAAGVSISAPILKKSTQQDTMESMIREELKNAVTHNTELVNTIALLQTELRSLSTRHRRTRKKLRAARAELRHYRKEDRQTTPRDASSDSSSDESASQHDEQTPRHVDVVVVAPQHRSTSPSSQSHAAAKSHRVVTKDAEQAEKTHALLADSRAQGLFCEQSDNDSDDHSAADDNNQRARSPSPSPPAAAAAAAKPRHVPPQKAIPPVPKKVPAHQPPNKAIPPVPKKSTSDDASLSPRSANVSDSDELSPRSATPAASSAGHLDELSPRGAVQSTPAASSAAHSEELLSARAAAKDKQSEVDALIQSVSGELCRSQPQIVVGIRPKSRDAKQKHVQHAEVIIDEESD